MRRGTGGDLAASIGCFDTEFVDFAVRRAVGDNQRLTTNGTVLDVGLLGHREIERQIDGLPAMRTAGAVTLDEDHEGAVEILIYFKVLSIHKLALSLFIWRIRGKGNGKAFAFTD